MDPFDFALAAELGRTVAELHATIGNREYLQWRAYYVYRNAMIDLAAKEATRG